MDEVRVKLHVGDGHCIEFAAKREYQRMAADIMAADGPPAPCDEAALDLLLDFLTRADFGRLRSSDDRLAGARNARCVLKRDAEGVPCVSIVDE